MKTILSTAVVATLVACGAFAQDIAGDWQATLKAGANELRLVLHVAKNDNGAWNATLFSIDQQPDGIPVDSISLQNSTLKFTINAVHGSYDGTVSADGVAIVGTWSQGQPLPLAFRRASNETAWPRDPSPHSIQFVPVDKKVKLEVLDWGGSGRPVVLLAGLGNTAHIFDKFAPKLTAAYHVYGITRRGFGASSTPAPDSANYTADRLGDDVLAVCDALKLNKPVLIGHSIAGEELSSIGSRHPEKIAALIYLDAGYSYAYYDRSRGDFLIDSVELEKKLKLLQPGGQPQDEKRLVRELLQTDIPQLEKDLHEREQNPQAPPAQSSAPKIPAVTMAIMAGQEKYTDIRVPVLAIYALPHTLAQAFGKEAHALAAAEAKDEVTTGAQAKAFETGVPSARVVRLPHANHFIFLSNEAEVLREANAFLASLP